MSKIITRTAVLLVATFLLTGCAHVLWQPAPGLIYSDVTSPWDASNGDLGTKHGSAQMTSILGLVATGDASIETAAKSAGITKITHVDFKSKSVLGVFAEFTVHVYGQ